MCVFTFIDYNPFNQNIKSTNDPHWKFLSMDKMWEDAFLLNSNLHYYITV